MKHRTPTAAAWVLLAVATLLPAAARAQDDDAARRLIREGQRQVVAGDLDEAVASYQLLLDRFAGTAEARQAGLAMAELRWAQNDQPGAMSYLDDLISNSPDSPEAAAAWVMRTQFRRTSVNELEDLLTLRNELRRVPILYGRDRFPSLVARGQSRVDSGEIALVIGEYDSAAADFLQAVEDEPISAFTPQAQHGLARAFMATGNWAAAVEILQSVTLSPDTATAAAAERALGYAHRHRLLPSSGQPAWRSTRSFSINEPSIKKPTRIAASDDGLVLLLDEGLKRVFLLSPDGNVLESQILESGRDVWFSTDDRPWVSDADSIRPLTGGVRLSLGTSSSDKSRNATNIVGGHTDALGRAVVADRGQSALMIYSRDARLLDTVAAREPIDVAGGLGQGTVHLLDRKADQVVRIGPDLSTVARWDGGWKKPVALSVDRANNIYVLDAGERTIQTLGENRSALGSVGPVLPGGIELKNPLDLAIDGQGRLYILDAREGILVLE